MDNRERAILKTLLYSDCFDYPLSLEEIYKFLITNEKIGKTEFHRILQNLNMSVKSSKGFYFLPGREELVKKREDREKTSLKKLQKAKKIIKILSLIPTVKLIGISGALSMKNSGKDDDVDIFVITKKDFVWTTRLLMIVFLLIFGVYRTKNSLNYSDKICLNMLLDENKMNLEKNLYIAHEIVQLIPIFERDNAYKAFILENKWVEDFMFNVLEGNKSYSKKKSGMIDHALIFLLNFFAFEKLSKFLQVNYMKKHITKEIIRDGILRLHPFNYGSYVLRIYKKKLRNLENNQGKNFSKIAP